MTKSYRLILLCLLVGISAGPAAACRYNVRETGFVYLGIESYRLFGYVDDVTSSEVISTLESTAENFFKDSNIKFELVNIDKQKDHEAMEFFSSNAGTSLPAAILLSPDGQTLDVPLTNADCPFVESLTKAFEWIISSPKRLEIFKQCAKKYGVILLIDGPDAQDNSQAQESVLGAIETVRSQMEFLPKPIAEAPVVITLDAKSLAEEKVLLWAMGTKVEDVNAPHAAIYYGKGRWVGPLFKGEQIRKENLLSVMYVVGADCECGLDYRWVQGTMLPAKWDDDIHKLVVESLGFDPESPMIKMEINSIVKRSIGPHTYSGEPFGYQEIVIESESPNDIEINEANEIVFTDVNRVIEANTPTETLSNQEPAKKEQVGILMSARLMAGLIIGIISVIIVIGIGILARARNL